MQPPDNKHKCPVCEATFTRSQHVARHMRSHTGDRPYKCTHCGDQFARSDLLSRHVNKCHSTDGKPPPVPRRRGGNRAAAAVATGSTAQAGSTQQKRQRDTQVPTFSHNDTTTPITENSLSTNALGMPTLAPQPFQFQAGYGQSVIDTDQKRRRFNNHAYGWPDSQSVTVPSQATSDYTFPSLDNGITAASSSKYARPGASAMPLYDPSLSLPPLPSLYPSPTYSSASGSTAHGHGHGRSASASATLMALRGHGYRPPSDPGVGGNVSDGNYSDFSTSSASSSAVHLPLDYSAISQIHSRAGEASQIGGNHGLSLASRGGPLLRHSQAVGGHTSTGLNPFPLDDAAGFNASSQSHSNVQFLIHSPGSHALAENLAPSGTFSSAFGLMSLDDPAVLAGLANDGVPFFSQATPGSNNNNQSAGVQGTPANGGSSAPSYMTHFPSVSTGFTPRGFTPRDGIPTGFTPREGEMGEFKDFWASFIRDPNPTTGGPDPGGALGDERGARPEMKSWNSGATVVPLGYRPTPHRQHSRSFPTTKNPGAEMVSRLEEQARHQEGRAGGAGMVNRSAGTLHNPDALRSYEQAVLARKAPQLTFTPRRGKGRMSADAGQLQQGPNPTDQRSMSRSEQANAIPTSHARGDGISAPNYGGQMPQVDDHQLQQQQQQQQERGRLDQAYLSHLQQQQNHGLTRGHLTPASFERQPSLGPGTGSSGSGSSPSNTTDSRPGTSSGVRMSQPIHHQALSQSLNQFGPTLYTQQQPFPGKQQPYHSVIQPLQDSSPYPDESAQTLSSRPSYKRLASQTLVSATSKRARESDDHEGDSFSFRFGLDTDADDEGDADDAGRPMTASSAVSTDSSWANLNYTRRMSNPENNMYGAARMHPHHPQHPNNLNRMALNGARIALISNAPPALASSIPENSGMANVSSVRKDDPTVNSTAVAQQ